MLVLGLVVLWVLLTRLMELVLVLLIAMVLAEGLRPLVERLVRLGLHRELARALVYLTLIGTLAVLIVILARPVVAESRMILSDLPAYEAELNRNITLILSQFSVQTDLSSQLSSSLGGAARTAFTLAAGFVRAVFDVVVVLLMSFLWLSASRPFGGFLLELLPPDRRPLAAGIWEEIARRFAGYVRGVAVNMVVIGLLSGTAAAFLGLPAAILLGVLAGLTEMIPIVGPILGAIPAVLLGFTISPVLALVVALVYLAIQQVEAHTLVPLVMRQAVGLPALAIVLALAAGGTLGGIGGALVAVPVASALQVIISRWAAPEIKARQRRPAT